MSRRKRDDNIAIYVGRCTRRHDQTATRRARKGRKRALNLPGVAHVDRGHLYPERRRHSLDGSQLGVPGGARRIPKNRHPHHTRRDLLEQLQPFPTHAVFETHEAGGVAARLPQTIDEGVSDRIAGDRENDWYRVCRLQQLPHGRGAMGKDYIGRERDQFRRVSANGVCIGGGPAGVDPHVATNAPTEILQLLQKGSRAFRASAEALSSMSAKGFCKGSL
jgi:hypothetical protein